MILADDLALSGNAGAVADPQLSPVVRRDRDDYDGQDSTSSTARVPVLWRCA